MRERERGKIRIGLVKAKSVITARHALRLSQTNSDASTSFVTTYEFSIEGGGGVGQGLIVIHPLKSSISCQPKEGKKKTQKCYAFIVLLLLTTWTHIICVIDDD